MMQSPFDDAIAVWQMDQSPENDDFFVSEAMSLCVQLKGTPEKWSGLIFSGQSYRLFATYRGLCFEVVTDAQDEALLISVPMVTIDSADKCVVIVRFTGPTLELFLDGVLVDEEWPIGLICEEGCQTGPAGVEWVGKVALWDRSLSDDEIVALSEGGKEELKSLGEQERTMQYWQPRGHNTSVGDCMPFFHEGRLSLFYLFDRRNHKSKWNLGAHQWAHSSTTDLIHWEHHPVAIPITEQWEGSICTGSVLYYDGTYYGFYSTRKPDSTQHLGLAVSIDGIHFKKTEPNPFASPVSPYKTGPYRDPTIFRGKCTGLFHLLVTAELVDPILASRGGCLAHLVSTDLKTWEVKEPFIVPGEAGHQPECPDYFEWNHWYYLLYSLNGVAYYRMSRNPLGPWHRSKVDVFDGPQARVMKTAAFTGDRRIGVAFLSNNGYGGYAVFREIYQYEDGTLGTKFPTEMIPENGEELTLPFKGITDGVSGDSHRIRMNAQDGFVAAMLSDVPTNLRVTAKVKPTVDSYYFGLCLRGSGNYESGHELRFEPFRQKVGWRDPQSDSVKENERCAIYYVEGLDQPFTIDIVAKDDILDLCFDDRRTLVIRLVDQLVGDRLFFFAQNANVTFEDISVRPLTSST